MNEEETAMPRMKKKRPRWNPFTNKLFTVCFSFLAAIVAWFLVSASNIGTEDQPFRLQNVEIELNFSEAATSGGLHIYNQNELTADVVIIVSSAVRNQLTENDVTVVGNFAPDSIKTTGTGLMTATVSLRAVKNNTLADYEIIEVSPSEIVVEYDRADSVTLEITEKIQRTVQTGYWVDTPVISESTVTVSGPESYVKQVSYAAVQSELSSPLSEDTTIVEEITLFGQDDREITDYEDLYLTLDVEEVEVTLPVLAKVTVPLETTYLGKPDGFAESRISVTPDTIDIAATQDEIDMISAVTLDTPINFKEVDFQNNTFNLEIPVPSNVQNLNNTETATVEFNLNGFKEVTRTTSNIMLINAPSDNVVATTKSLSVKIIGSEAQVARLTGDDNILVLVDLTGWTEDSGNMSLPATVTISGADTCWAVGDYTVTVDISAEIEETMAELEASDSD